MLNKKRIRDVMFISGTLNMDGYCKTFNHGRVSRWFKVNVLEWVMPIEEGNKEYPALSGPDQTTSFSDLVARGCGKEI